MQRLSPGEKDQIFLTICTLFCLTDFRHRFLFFSSLVLWNAAVGSECMHGYWMHLFSSGTLEMSPFSIKYRTAVSLVCNGIGFDISHCKQITLYNSESNAYRSTEGRLGAKDVAACCEYYIKYHNGFRHYRLYCPCNTDWIDANQQNSLREPIRSETPLYSAGSI